MNTRMIVQGLSTVVIVAMISVVAACAKGDKGGRPQGPPPEAFEACEGKAEGDSVSFKGPRGESLEATCEMMNDQLVAVPEGHKSRK